MNAIAGHNFFSLGCNDAWERLERLAEDSRQNATLERARGAPRRVVNDVGMSSDLPAKVDALTQKLDQFISVSLSHNSQPSYVSPTPSHPSIVEVCAVCSDFSHETTACPHEHEL